jgi:hypothetical protein
VAGIDDLSSADLKKLLAKRESEEKASKRGSARLNVSLDLGDEKQVGLARKLGFIDLEDDADDGGEGETDEVDADETPGRGGYFKE